MKNNPLLLAQIFDEYERRFASAKAQRAFEPPITSEQKSKVVEKVKKMICFDYSLIPTISNAKVVKQQDFGKFVEYQVVYNTWQDVFGVATVMFPKTDKPVPMTLVLCGHGKKGRLTESFSLMAHRLARSGTAVIVPDNIGQGDREFMGHWKVLSPFFANLNFLGLIVAETLALINAIKKHPKIDPERLCACGNSGGGMLALFLSALAPELKGLSASGYPSEFFYILSKEKTHCACNLIKCGTNSVDMWEILSLFAPKPLLLSQGKHDDLIPKAIAQKNARKVKQVYSMLNAEDSFKFALTNTKHSWEEEDRILIVDFLCGVLGTKPCIELNETELIPDLENRSVKLPQNAIDVDELVFNLTGKLMPNGLALHDIVPSTFQGKALDCNSINAELDGLDAVRIFAQMEYALKQI